jgi:hypothetical protein
VLSNQILLLHYNGLLVITINEMLKYKIAVTATFGIGRRQVGNKTVGFAKAVIT